MRRKSKTAKQAAERAARKRKANAMSINEIAKAAKAAGMTYGEYVKQMESGMATERRGAD